MEKQMQLLLQELQQRIGQMAAHYEVEMASLKVQAATRIEELEEKIKELEAE